MIGVIVIVIVRAGVGIIIAGSIKIIVVVVMGGNGLAVAPIAKLSLLV
jgi:hypothetical protein